MSAAVTTKTIGGAKNGGQRTIPTQKAQKWYAAEEAGVLKTTRKSQRPQKLRSSLQPGTVLILLAGRFRGKRVVYLKRLEDNTLLVTGPFKINGVPLKRVNSRYVIATSTKVSIDALNIDSIDAKFFEREESKKSKSGEAEFFNDEKETKTISEDKIKIQKQIDSTLLNSIKKTPLLKQYLGSSFSLKNGDRPHLLNF